MRAPAVTPLPWMFKQLGIGPLIGTRTWGGLIGIGGYPTFDRWVAELTARAWGLFNPKTESSSVENKGVSPDVEVDLDPRALAPGHDPQLEKASRALTSLKETSRAASETPEVSGVQLAEGAFPTRPNPAWFRPEQLSGVNKE